MLISRRAFRLLVALAIGTASAHSYATDYEWESGADAYSAAAVCPYGACHSGRDYLADPVPAVIESTTADTTAADAAASGDAANAAVPADSAANEFATADNDDSIPAAPAANPITDNTQNAGCGYDGLHPAYGHPYSGHSYYQYLQYGHGPCHDEAPAAQEPTCQYPESDEPVAAAAPTDAVATEDAMFENAVPPTPSEESLPAEPQFSGEESPILSDDLAPSVAAGAVVELAEEPLENIEVAALPSDETTSTDTASAAPTVESLTPSPYPYGHGHPVYSSKGYPFHFLNQPYDPNLPANVAAGRTETAAAVVDDAAATAVEPTAPVATESAPATESASSDDSDADNAHCDPAPEYNWAAVANSNCDQDEELRLKAESDVLPADTTHDDYRDLVPNDELPNYDYPIETPSTGAAPAEASDAPEFDQFEFDGHWPADEFSAEPINIGLIRSSITLIAQFTGAIRHNIGQLDIPAWLSAQLESAQQAAAQVESSPVSSEAGPQFEQHSDIGRQRDAMLALARSIDRFGLSLQHLARQMERVADDDMIGRLGTPTDRIER